MYLKAIKNSWGNIPKPKKKKKKYIYIYIYIRVTLKILFLNYMLIFNIYVTILTQILIA